MFMSLRLLGGFFPPTWELEPWFGLRSRRLALGQREICAILPAGPTRYGWTFQSSAALVSGSCNASRADRDSDVLMRANIFGPSTLR
jgi:hypothetical protein